MHPNVPQRFMPRQPGPPVLPSIPGRPASESKPWDLLLIIAAGLLLVGQARVHVFVPGASALRPALLLSALGLAVWATRNRGMRSLKHLQSPFMKAAWFIPIWAAIGVPFAMYQGGAARFLVGGLAPAFVVFLIVTVAVRNLEDVRRLVGVFAAGTAVYALMSPQNPIGRAFGAGGYDANDSAMFLVSGIPLLVYFTLFGRKPWVKMGAGLGTLLSLYSVIGTQSRGGFIALVAVLGFMVLMLKGVKPALRATVVVVVVLASIPVASAEYWDRMQTIQELDDGYGEGIGGRRNIWARAMGYTFANPVTGVGINNFTVAEGNHPDIRERIQRGVGTKYSVAHSQWFHVLAELGIPGFIAFAAMFLIGLKELRKIQRHRGRSPPPFQPREIRVMAGVLMASLIAIIVAGSLLSNPYAAMTWGPFGVIGGFLKVYQRPSRPNPPAPQDAPAMVSVRGG